MKCLSRVAYSGIVACHEFGLLSEHAGSDSEPEQCARCGSLLLRRKPDSIARSWAFLVTALIAYIPANVLPVMHSELLGHASDNTLLQGIVDFWKSGSIAIAAVIFFASVLVPCSKFLILAVLLLTAQTRYQGAMHERAELYRLIERIGYWSMLDLVVVAVAASLVKFSTLAAMEPRAGIMFFGMMVLFTILSTMNFDPRLTWDGGPQRA